MKDLLIGGIIVIVIMIFIVYKLLKMSNINVNDKFSNGKQIIQITKICPDAVEYKYIKEDGTLISSKIHKTKKAYLINSNFKKIKS